MARCRVCRLPSSHDCSPAMTCHIHFAWRSALVTDLSLSFLPTPLPNPSNRWPSWRARCSRCRSFWMLSWRTMAREQQPTCRSKSGWKQMQRPARRQQRRRPRRRPRGQQPLLPQLPPPPPLTATVLAAARAAATAAGPVLAAGAAPRLLAGMAASTALRRQHGPAPRCRGSSRRLAVGWAVPLLRGLRIGSPARPCIPWPLWPSPPHTSLAPSAYLPSLCLSPYLTPQILLSPPLCLMCHPLSLSAAADALARRPPLLLSLPPFIALCVGGAHFSRSPCQSSQQTRGAAAHLHTESHAHTETCRVTQTDA